MKKKSRLVIGILIVLLTIAAFAYYLSHHSYLLKQLGHTPGLTVVWLLLLYVAWFATLALILQAMLWICRKTMPPKDNLLLNAYSSLVNFFVPGQGGPIVRGAYLNKRHNLRVSSYIFVLLLYYGCYAVVSAFLLLFASRPWWQTVFALLIVGAISIIAVRIYSRRSKTNPDSFNLSPASLAYLLLATVLQAAVQITIYAVELHSVNSHISLEQSMTYTGAANFALFVALTPGAIGIRESFLLFSRSLHHISSANIVSASIIDRAVFLVFLAILFVVTIVFHAKNKMSIKQSPES
jgi:uncharacterized membrane protein YbhN (UPF0104 family)